MNRNKRVDTIMNKAMTIADGDGRDLTLGPRYRKYIHTEKYKNLQRLERVRKKLAFIEPDETLLGEGQSMKSVPSASETITDGNKKEITGLLDNDPQHYNNSEALVEEIFGDPSSPNLGFVSADISKEQGTLPADDYPYVPDVALPGEAPSVKSVPSTSETITDGNKMEITGQLDYDQQHQNNNEALMEEIVGGPSSPNLEFVPADISEEQGKFPADEDYSLVEIGKPEKTTDVELRNIEVELNLLETSTASNAQEQTVQNTESGLTTPEMYTASNTQVSANSTNVGCSKSGGSNTKKPQKGRKRKCKTDKIYIDYLSDEDYSTFIDCEEAAISDEWLGSTSSSNDNEVVSKTAKAKKYKKSKKTKTRKQNTSLDDTNEEIVGGKGLKKKRTNLRKERSQKRIAGQEYVRSDGKTIESKSIQPNPCIGKKCGNNCENIDAEKRQKVFDHFWGLSEKRRKDWLVSITQKEDIKRKRVDSAKRSATFKYHVNEGEGRRPVCLQFLSATLNISSKTIYHTVKNSNWGCAKEDLRGKHVPPNKTKPATIETVINFIKSLPAVPSHYCRHDSTRVYLTHDYKNVAYLYSTYRKRSEENGVDFVSERIFRKIFSDDFNIGFHVPKKDKCLKCLKFEQTDISDPAKAEEKAEHETEKDESYNRFFAHKNIHKSDPNALCVSFDLEKVLNTPYGESMLFYYSRKLAVYNLCFYENGTRKVFCNYWDESDGKRGANEISSILHRYILSVDERGNVKNLYKLYKLYKITNIFFNICSLQVYDFFNKGLVTGLKPPPTRTRAAW